MRRKNVLVTGGAGFIGAHIVNELIDLGHKVIVLDDLSGGFKENVNKKATFIKGSIVNTKLANDLVIEYPLLDIKNFGGGVIDVSLNNKFEIIPILKEINIKGAGVWTI